MCSLQVLVQVHYWHLQCIVCMTQVSQPQRLLRCFGHWSSIAWHCRHPHFNAGVSADGALHTCIFSVERDGTTFLYRVCISNVQKFWREEYLADCSSNGIWWILLWWLGMPYTIIIFIAKWSQCNRLERLAVSTLLDLLTYCSVFPK